MAEFASDDFAGTEGDLLDTYSAAWTKHVAGSATTAEIASGRVRGTAAGGAMYYHSGSPINADYSVSADVYEVSDPTNYGAGVVGRVDTTAFTCYMARHARATASSIDAWQLFKFVAGTVTQLGSNSTDAITTGTSAQVRLRVLGTTIELYKRGEATATISVTDSAITAAGKAGIRLGLGGGNTPTDTTLYHLDNFSAVDIGGDQTLTPSLFTNSNTFYAPTVSGTYTLSPGLYTDSDTFYSPTVSTSYSITPGLHTDPDTFYSPAVSATYTLTPGLYDDGDTFYTHVVSLGGSQTLVPGLYVDSDTFYSPTVSSTYTLTPALYADPDTFYSATISSTYVIAPTLYVDPDTFYAATVGSFGGPQTLLPSLYVDPDTFYVHTITGGLGSGVGQRTRYITVEFYDSGDVWRTNIARDILEYSAQPSKIAFSYVSPQDSISYASGTDKIHYTRGQVMGSIQRRSAFKKVFVAPPPPPPPPPTDPYFSNVVALLHMDGADGSTVFTDVKGHTFTANGNAQIDTAQSRFGGASLLLDGAGDFVQSAPSAALGFATGDFTIEGQFKRNGLSTNQGIYVRGLLTGGFNQTSLAHAVFLSADNKLNFRVYTGGANTTITTAATVTDTASFHHFAMCAAGSTLYGFLDGVLVGSTAYTSQNNSSSWPSVIGSFGAAWGLHFNGHIDEVRVTKGVARYTANFTPPTEPFLDQ